MDQYEEEKDNIAVAGPLNPSPFEEVEARTCVADGGGITIRSFLCSPTPLPSFQIKFSR